MAGQNVHGRSNSSFYTPYFWYSFVSKTDYSSTAITTSILDSLQTINLKHNISNDNKIKLIITNATTAQLEDLNTSLVTSTGVYTADSTESTLSTITCKLFKKVTFKQPDITSVNDATYISDYIFNDISIWQLDQVLEINGDLAKSYTIEGLDATEYKLLVYSDSLSSDDAYQYNVNISSTYEPGNVRTNIIPYDFTGINQVTELTTGAFSQMDKPLYLKSDIPEPRLLAQEMFNNTIDPISNL